MYIFAVSTHLISLCSFLVNVQTKEGVYGGICEYKIVSEEDLEHPCPFPPCVHTTWGPGDSAAKFDMVPLQAGCILRTNDGVAEARFRMETKYLSFSFYVSFCFSVLLHSV